MTGIKLSQDGALRLRLSSLIHLLVTASSGGGKSNVLMLLLERTYGQIPHLVLDWEGEFVTLRANRDYVIVGKDGDLPLDPRTAGMFVRKMLEMGFSAIIDLSEAPVRRRLEWVRAAFEEMNDLPREYWNDLLIVVDEAHYFANEEERKARPSLAKDALVDIASKGRKRGWRLILATQRLSKLDKDVAAECRSKLVGFQNLAIDRRRAAGELAAGRDVENQLLTLKAGHFYALGEALGQRADARLVLVELAETRPPKRGAKRTRTPPARGRVLEVLDGLSDLPQQAAAEIRTLAESQAEVARLRSHVKLLERGMPAVEPQVVEKVVEKVVEVSRPMLGKRDMVRLRKGIAVADDGVAAVKSAGAALQGVESKLQEVAATLGAIAESARKEIAARPPPRLPPTAPVRARPVPDARLVAERGDVKIIDGPAAPRAARTDGSLPKGEAVMLAAIAQNGDGAERDQLTVLTGYKRSTRDTYIQRLKERGLVQQSPDETLVATADGIAALGDFKPLPTGDALREHWLDKLPLGEKRVLEALIPSWPAYVPRDTISEMTGYARSSRDTYLQRLQSRRLVECGSSGVKANDQLFSTTGRS